jgi:hypothetical protein
VEAYDTHTLVLSLLYSSILTWLEIWVDEAQTGYAQYIPIKFMTVSVLCDVKYNLFKCFSYKRFRFVCGEFAIRFLDRIVI